MQKSRILLVLSVRLNTRSSQSRNQEKLPQRRGPGRSVPPHTGGRLIVLGGGGTVARSILVAISTLIQIDRQRLRLLNNVRSSSTHPGVNKYISPKI